jgi:hypothetical protein
VLPGLKVSIPVLAKQECLVASLWEWRISLAAASMASERLAKSVVPVWQSWPLTVMVCQRYDWTYAIKKSRPTIGFW